MSKRKFRAVGFRMGIATAFVLLFAPSIGLITWFVYAQNSKLVRDIADSIIAESSDAIITESGSLFDPVGATVDALGGVGDIDPQALRSPDLIKSMLRTIQDTRQFYSLFIGFVSDGSFSEVIRIPKGLQKFGPSQTPVPAKAGFVLRTVKRPPGEPAVEQYVYVTETGEKVLTETAQAAPFELTAQTFFKTAAAEPGKRKITDLVAYDTSEKVGVTVARTFSHGGQIVGVVGGNISLDKFSYFLRHNVPGKHGIAIILDAAGKLVAHPDPAQVARRQGTSLTIMSAAELNSPAVRGALPGHRFGSERRLYKAADGHEYVASFKPFTDTFGKRWEILIVVPTNDFIGGLKKTTEDVLLLGAVILLLGILAIRSLSAMFTKPIGKLITQTQRIRKFDLEGSLELHSNIAEIAHLVESTAAMKTALQFVSHFMPKQLVRDLLATGKNIGTGGESRVITVMFTDLASFSSLAEKVTPAALTERVSDYLDVVSSEAIKQHGTIDKYIGDAVMALWNAPDLDPDHIAHACLAALNGVRALEVSNQRWAEKHWPPLRMRVGLHTDRVIVGVIGSSEFVSYTALGDGVNIASRLEGINKSYGTQICVSHTIYTAVSDRFLMRPLDYVAVKGRKEPILIYELMGEQAAGAPHAVSAARRELAALTVEAFAAWAAKDPALALGKFRALLARFPGDSVGEFYVKRCTEELSALPAPAGD